MSWGPVSCSACTGSELSDPSLIVLMRHRAVLFGIVGGILLAGAADRTLRPMALGVGLVSVVTFLWIARGTNQPALVRVVRADWIALVALVSALGTRSVRLILPWLWGLALEPQECGVPDD